MSLKVNFEVFVGTQVIIDQDGHDLTEGKLAWMDFLVGTAVAQGFGDERALGFAKVIDVAVNFAGPPERSAYEFVVGWFCLVSTQNYQFRLVCVSKAHFSVQ
jgi:hypothetical protein